MDYYLRTISKELFLQDLKDTGIDIEISGNYYQDNDIIIDWIGKIPNKFNLDVDGNLIGEITYKEDYHVNIRSLNPIDISLFKNTFDVHPSTPYRIFS
jgi:hypothetical protein